MDRDKAFTNMADAIGGYLDAIGWRALVVGGPRIQSEGSIYASRVAGPAPFGRYELVLEFTGGEKRKADAPIRPTPRGRAPRRPARAARRR